MGFSLSLWLHLEACFILQVLNQVRMSTTLRKKLKPGKRTEHMLAKVIKRHHLPGLPHLLEENGQTIMCHMMGSLKDRKRILLMEVTEELKKVTARKMEVEKNGETAMYHMKNSNKYQRKIL